MFIKALAIWLLLIIAEILHGILRGILLVPQAGRIPIRPNWRRHWLVDYPGHRPGDRPPDRGRLEHRSCSGSVDCGSA